MRRALRPDQVLTVSEWADTHRRLSGKAASEPGPWRTDRTPYLREIMDCLSSSSPVQRIVFMKGAQIGGTECGNNWIGYVIHHSPGPMLAILPTVEMAKRNSKQRLDPLIEDSDVIRNRVRPARSRDSGNTILQKEFQGGVLVLTGANSAAGLRSMPVRFLFLDEVDAYPGDVEGEGDPVALAEARTRTFARRKILMVSTPTIRGISRIEREYELSDQRKYMVPCPECGTHQWLKFEQLKWPKGEPEEALYECEHCELKIEERHKTWMLQNGYWEAQAECDGRTAGFHLSSLYSPYGWRSWAQIARAWVDAQGSDAAIKSFKNTELGETYVETGEAPDWQRLYERRDPYPAGYVHLPQVDEEYLKQLCSEQLITSKNRRGYAVREWQKTRERNEALDCYVYARAAAAVEGLDRFGDRHWREMERSLGLDEPVPRPSEDNQPNPPARKPVRRRARSKGVKL